MIKCSIFVAALCAASLVAAEGRAEGRSGKPMNVLLLVADDLNSWILEDANRYSGKVVAPNLKQLAASGVNFTRAYTAAPVCSPSRTAYFSGVSPWTSGHYRNALQVDKSEPLNNAISLAGTFKQAGYTTCSFGKITHGWDQREHWDVRLGHKRDPAPPDAPLTPIGRGEQDWGPIHLAEGEMNDSQNADATIAQLQEQHDKPFFIAFGTFNPHMPWYVPKKYFDMFPLDDLPVPKILENDLDDVPPRGRKLTEGKAKYVDQIMSHGLHKEAVQAYLATTAYVDVQFGRVLDALEESPHRDNTIVIFLSDHGFHLGEKHHWQKNTLWEEATHSLLMIRAPGTTPAGGVSKRFVSLQDIYPTLVELCGLQRPGYLEGRSLAPLLKDPQATWTSTAITCHCNSNQPVQAFVTIRNDLGRYIRYETGQEEFYDTTKDPREWTNLIDSQSHSATIEKLRQAVPDLAKMAAPLPPVQRKSKSR